MKTSNFTHPGGRFLPNPGVLTSVHPTAARMVMVLRYQEDLEPAEIAELIEMPLATVKSHLHRSLAMLRQKLARRGVGEP